MHTLPDKDTWIAENRDPERIAAEAERIRATAAADQVYADPHPDKVGTDLVIKQCGRCGGSGFYHGPSNAAWSHVKRDQS